MKLEYINTDQRFHYEIDMEELRQDAKLKCFAIVKDRKLFSIHYENGHRFNLTNEKIEKVKELIKQDLKRLQVI